MNMVQASNIRPAVYCKLQLIHIFQKQINPRSRCWTFQTGSSIIILNSVSLRKTLYWQIIFSFHHEKSEVIGHQSYNL